MNLAIRIVTVASLGLNIGLGYLYINERQKSEAQQPLTMSARGASTPKVPLPDVTSLKGYYKKLQELDISEQDRRQLVLAQLKRTNFPLPSTAEQFWQVPKPAELPNAAAVVRGTLVSLFGDAAWTEATFAEFFRPLQLQLPFLSAQKQVALEQLFIAARDVAQKQSTLDLDWAQQRRIADEAAAKIEQSVQQILEPKEYAEYELRMSRLAQSLRMMNLDVSESQYRSLYAAVRQNAELQKAVTRTLAEPKPSSALYDSQVASVLGPEKYVKFMAQCDPLYSMMSSLTRAQNVAPEAVKIAYAELVKSQAAITKMQASKDPGLTAALSARRQKLTAALGAPVAMMVESMLGGAHPFAGQVPTRSLLGAR